MENLIDFFKGRAFLEFTKYLFDKNTDGWIKSILGIFFLILIGLKFTFNEDDRLLPLIYITAFISIVILITYYIRSKNDEKLKKLENEKNKAELEKHELEEEIKNIENKLDQISSISHASILKIKGFLLPDFIIDNNAKKNIELELSKIEGLIKIPSGYTKEKQDEDVDRFIHAIPEDRKKV